MLSTIKKFFRNEDGATLVEYALIIALVAIVALAGIKLLGSNSNNTLSSAATNIQTSTSGH